MNASATRQTRDAAFTTGSVDQWSDAWSSVLDDPARALTYTAGAPRTVKALYHRFYFEDLWSMMGASAQTARYLELGAGRGTTSMYLRARGCDVTMLDLSDEAIELARRTYDLVGIPVPKMVKANGEATGLPANSFECIYNIGLLEHFEDPRKVLAESLRLLSPGGLLFSVVVPLVSPLRAAVAQSVFSPWKLPRTIVRTVRTKAAGMRVAAGEALRTTFGARDYERWAKEIGASDVSCIPYNPYRECYDSAVWQGRLQVPLYRLHHAVRALAGSTPSMRCARGVAQCELLTFRKPQ